MPKIAAVRVMSVSPCLENSLRHLKWILPSLWFIPIFYLLSSCLIKSSENTLSTAIAWSQLCSACCVKSRRKPVSFPNIFISFYALHAIHINTGRVVVFCVHAPCFHIRQFRHVGFRNVSLQNRTADSWLSRMVFWCVKRVNSSLWNWRELMFSYCHLEWSVKCLTRPNQRPVSPSARRLRHATIRLSWQFGNKLCFGSFYAQVLLW